MLSKEAILTQAIDRGKGYVSVYDVSDFDVTQAVLTAMEEYGRQSYNQGVEDAIEKANMGLDHCELVDDRTGQALMNQLINELEALKKKQP